MGSPSASFVMSSPVARDARLPSPLVVVGGCFMVPGVGQTFVSGGRAMAARPKWT